MANFTATLSGTHLFGWSGGDGRPVLLLHGNWVDHRAVLLLARSLASAGFRAVAPDLRGFGRSGRPGRYDFATWAADCREVAQHLGLEKPVVLGAGIGARVALTLALTYPKELASLILLGAASPYGRPIAKLPRAAARIEELPGLDPGARRAWLSERAKYYMHEPNAAAVAMAEEYLLPGMLLADPLAMEAMSDPAFDVRARLGDLNLPTLVVHGRNDQVCPMGNALEYFGAIRSASVTIMAGTGNTPQYEHPGDTTGILLTWLGAPGQAA